MKWHELKWPEIDALSRDLPVIVPLGSIEQHGNHLPLNVDTLQVASIAEQAEEQLGERALFLPTQWLGCSEHHMDFPGTISQPPAVYSAMITAIVSSVLRHGFRRILLLNGHGGNEAPAAQSLNELVARDDTADAAMLVFSSWWQLASPAIEQDVLGFDTPRISHACEYETSLTMFLRPDLVDFNAAADTSPAINDVWHHSHYGGRVRVFKRWHRLTESGGMGRPLFATPQKGERLLRAVVAEVVAFAETFAGWPVLPICRTRRQAPASE